MDGGHMQTTTTQTCQICKKEIGNVNEFYGHRICDFCLLIAIDMLEREIEQFEYMTGKHPGPG
jgi:hypothetical protein